MCQAIAGCHAIDSDPGKQTHSKGSQNMFVKGVWPNHRRIYCKLEPRLHQTYYRTCCCPKAMHGHEERHTVLVCIQRGAKWTQSGTRVTLNISPIQMTANATAVDPSIAQSLCSLWRMRPQGRTQRKNIPMRMSLMRKRWCNSESASEKK